MLNGAPRENGRLKECDTLCSPLLFFVVSLVSGIGERYFGISGLVGRGILGLLRTILMLKFLTLVVFLLICDCALDTDADFLAVVEHRLVPARARSEGKRLWRAGVRSVWAPASLEGGHVGHAGVGVVSLRVLLCLCLLFLLLVSLNSCVLVCVVVRCWCVVGALLVRCWCVVGALLVRCWCVVGALLVLLLVCCCVVVLLCVLCVLCVVVVFVTGSRDAILISTKHHGLIGMSPR